MRALLPVLFTAAALTLAACGDDENGAPAATDAAAQTTTASPEEAASDAASEEPSGEASCKKVEAPRPKPAKVDKPSGTLDATKTNTVVFDTSCGSFTVELDAKGNPKTANVVASLAEDGFYDGTSFHRIIPGFMNQGGDPNGDGSGGPDWSVVEKPADDTRYTRGVVAMAKTATDPAGTSGSQFFVMTADNPMPPDYAVAGKVSKGMDVVDAIAQQGSPSGTPAMPVVIEKATFKTS